MGKTKIEWTSETWNIITGCTKYSEGCQNCYAEKMHKRLTAMGINKYQEPFNKVVFHAEELTREFGKKTKMIFVNSMCDTFHKDVSDSKIQLILDECCFNEPHIFQILTKRAERLPIFEYPANVWLGVTVEMARYKSRMDFLKQTNAKIKFLSCEPLLEDLGELDLPGIDWVIVGGETGHNARPCHPDWVRNIQKQCEEQKVPFFFKQWGEWTPYPKSDQQYKKVCYFKTTECGMTETKLIQCMYKVGKTKAGAILDGKEYKEMPIKEFLKYKNKGGI